MKGPIDLNLSRRLAELRRHAGMSLSELATATGIHRATASRYERAEIGISAQRMKALAAAMHIDAHYLFMPPGAPLPKIRFRRSSSTAPAAADWNDARLNSFLSKLLYRDARDDIA